jgi:hypothetical protein
MSGSTTGDGVGVGVLTGGVDCPGAGPTEFGAPLGPDDWKSSSRFDGVWLGWSSGFIIPRL